MNRSSEMTKITMSIAATTQTIKLPLTMTQRRRGVGALHLFSTQRHSGDHAKGRWPAFKASGRGALLRPPRKNPGARPGRGAVDNA